MLTKIYSKVYNINVEEQEKGITIMTNQLEIWYQQFSNNGLVSIKGNGNDDIFVNVDDDALVVTMPIMDPSDDTFLFTIQGAKQAERTYDFNKHFKNYKSVDYFAD